MDFSIRPLTTDELVTRDEIRDLARTAANDGQHVNAANTYPVGTPEHHAFEFEYWAAVHDSEALSLV